MKPREGTRDFRRCLVYFSIYNSIIYVIYYIYIIYVIYIIFIIYRMYYHVLCMNHLIFEGRDPILTTQVSLTCNGYVSADPSRQQGERAKKSKKERWTEGKTTLKRPMGVSPGNTSNGHVNWKTDF